VEAGVLSDSTWADGAGLAAGRREVEGAWDEVGESSCARIGTVACATAKYKKRTATRLDMTRGYNMGKGVRRWLRKFEVNKLPHSRP